MAARTIGKEERGEEWSGEMERGSLKSRARLADNNGGATSTSGKCRLTRRSFGV